MKIKYIYIVLTFFSLLVFTTCKSTSRLTKEQKIEDVENKMKEKVYTFVAARVNPMSGQSVYLTSSYSLEVKTDSIIAFLPYFGRAYSAPSPMEEGGIKFTSTDFEYTLSEKKKGVYRVAIDIKDNPNNYQLSLLIGEAGSGTLYVSQMHKQSITFYGNIE